MRRLSLAATIMALGLFVAASAWADVPDCDASYVYPESTFINASPDYTVTGTDAEREVTVDLYIVVAGSGAPYEDYPADRISFVVTPHSDYPNLGGGAGGNCPDCEDLYTVTLPAAPNDSTDANGMIPVTISVGNGCAPSMCCPVEIEISLSECGAIAANIGVLQNSHDMVAAGASGGVVNLSDIAAFTVSLATYQANPTSGYQPCADWVFSAGAVQWGEINLSDIAAFTVHINEFCTPFTDPCL